MEDIIKLNHLDRIEITLNNGCLIKNALVIIHPDFGLAVVFTKKKIAHYLVDVVVLDGK